MFTVGTLIKFSKGKFDDESSKSAKDFTDKNLQTPTKVDD
jgi:hypothetical protein